LAQKEVLNSTGSSGAILHGIGTSRWPKSDLGLKLGIVSNTFVTASSLDRHLEQYGILDFFPVRLYSYELDFRKPDARIFKAAAEKIGEKAENILFVGDRINKDIKPAAKAGMRAVLKAAYTNVGRELPKGVRKINKLSELPALIEKINSELTSAGQ
jgi:FMN phosphatase YigB (HAD superfamily)